jgi:integrase
MPGRASGAVGERSEPLEAQVQLKPSTRARYDGLLRGQVLPTWERVPLSSVTHAEVAAWVGRLAASGIAPSTIRQAHRVLALVLALAVRDGRISRNPATGVRLPRLVDEGHVFLSHEEVDGLAQECGRYELLVRLLAYTGLRWGEAAALRVKRVDLLRRRVEVAESVTEVVGKATSGTPKGHQRRWVPLPRSLVPAPREQIEGKGPDDLVFTSPSGGVLRNQNFRMRVFRPAAKAAGLDGLTPHDLRHTASSLAVAAGANVKAVQRMLGHASAAMTLDVYAGLFGEDLEAVADRLDEAASQARADSVRTTGLRAVGSDHDADAWDRP